jgi:hypothetical protein
MNQPEPHVRLAGSNTGSALFLLASGVLMAAVVEGEAPGWVLLVALLLASFTLNAVQQMREYKAWEGEWQEMQTGKRVEPPQKKKYPKLDVAVGLLSLVVIPWIWSQRSDPGERLILAGSWVVMFLVVVFLAVRGIVRSVRARRRFKEQARRSQVEPVAWLVSPASSSPSRADAMRELPEYSARLLIEGGNRTEGGIAQ